MVTELNPVLPTLQNESSSRSPSPELELGDLSNLSSIDWVSKTAEYVPRNEAAKKDDPLSGLALYEKVKSLGVPIPISEGTFSATGAPW